MFSKGTSRLGYSSGRRNDSKRIEMQEEMVIEEKDKHMGKSEHPTKSK